MIRKKIICASKSVKGLFATLATLVLKGKKSAAMAGVPWPRASKPFPWVLGYIKNGLLTTDVTGFL
jgi:hypothetical protein